MQRPSPVCPRRSREWGMKRLPPARASERASECGLGDPGWHGWHGWWHGWHGWARCCREMGRRSSRAGCWRHRSSAHPAPVRASRERHRWRVLGPPYRRLKFQPAPVLRVAEQTCSTLRARCRGNRPRRTRLYRLAIPASCACVHLLARSNPLTSYQCRPASLTFHRAVES